MWREHLLCAMNCTQGYCVLVELKNIIKEPLQKKNFEIKALSGRGMLTHTLFFKPWIRAQSFPSRAGNDFQP